VNGEAMAKKERWWVSGSMKWWSFRELKVSKNDGTLDVLG